MECNPKTLEKICHDLKQPLQVISGYAELLGTTKLDKDGTKYLKSLNLSIERLGDLKNKKKSHRV